MYALHSNFKRITDCNIQKSCGRGRVHLWVLVESDNLYLSRAEAARYKKFSKI